MVPSYPGKAVKTNTTTGVFNSTMAIVHPSKGKLITLPDGTIKCPNLWSYRNAFFFTGTIGTTIGYGNVYPVTPGGKVFCVFYALTSIPLFGFFMGKIGDTLKLYMGRILVACYGTHPTKGQAFTVLMSYVVFGSVIFSILPAVGFHCLEGWLRGFTYIA